MNHTWPSAQAYQQETASGMDIRHYLKILNPACRKEGEVHVLHGMSVDAVESPDLLKCIMDSQYYRDQLPDHEQTEIGYFTRQNLH